MGSNFFYNNKNRKANINWRTKNSKSIKGSNWTNIRATTTKANSYHIRSMIITLVTKHTKVVIMGTNNNISPNKCMVISRGTKKKTNSECNKESTIDSIWNTTSINKSNYNIDRLNY